MKYCVNESCIGCGLCESTCPEVFKMTENNVAEAIDSEVPADAVVSAEEAWTNCPVSAIEQKD